MSGIVADTAEPTSQDQSGGGGPTERHGSFFAFHLFVCCNRRPDGHARGSCAARGSERLRDYMKARARELGVPRTRINSAGCLDRCELGPCVVVYPDAAWYRVESEADVDLLLDAHLRRDERPAALLLSTE